MTPFDQLPGQLIKAGDNLKAAERPIVTSASNVARDLFTGIASGMGAGGPRGVKVTTKQLSSNGHAAASVKYGPNPGWVKIMEGQVGPHFIGPKGRGGKRAKSLRKQNTMKGSRRAMGMAVASMLGGTVGGGTSGAIGIPGVGPRAWAHHPGIHKKKPFVAAAQAAVPPPVIAEVRKRTAVEFAKAFKG